MFSTQAKWPLALTLTSTLTSLLWLPILMAAGQPEFSNANAVEALPATSNVMHQLAKRMDLEVCIGHFDVHKNTIIRTGESQAIGGKYLQGLELDTIEECERLCCETDACDVYIFERKAGGYCYLFECGPPENFHCKFTRHANYTSAVLTPQEHHASEPLSTPRPMLPHIPSNNISQQEWELSNLKLKPEVRDKSAAGGSAAAAATALATGVAPGSAGQSASSPSHCGRFQFSCHSGECIAVYNACDGIPQCEDGSDEGPECNAVSSSATKPSSTNNNNLDTPKPIVSHYNPTNLQQQHLQAMQPQTQSIQQEQQVVHSISLGPPPPPPPPPPMVNNREDAAAWANRKIIANAQSQPQNQGEILNQDGQLNSHSIFNHKGGLQFQVTNVAQGQGQSQLTAYNNNDNNNNNGQLSGNSLYGMSLPRSGIYMPPAQQQQQQQQEAQQQQLQLPQNLAWPQAAVPAPQQQQQSLLVQQQQQPPAQGPAYTVVNDGNAQLMPVKPMMPHVAASPQQQQGPQIPQQQAQQQQPVHLQQQVLLPVLNAAPSHGKVDEEEYEDYEEEKSTEAPKKKQRKHKKTKSKTNNPSSKDPIELALEQTKQMPPAVPASPVHEQYKMIHDNLELEFRDHDGHSERPGGAVLSLTMGLLVTAALAILIGCRMRTVGRRARRLGGKTPYSQEADFLVNGMYL